MHLEKYAPIDGTTRLFYTLADPIAHIRAPQVFNPLFAKRACNAAMLPLHVSARDLPVLWEGLRTTRNLDGFLLTIPHKSAAARLCDTTGPRAQRTGAVNIVCKTDNRTFHGDIFDGCGFVAGLERRGNSVQGKRVLLAGAGGAGVAIADALAGAGVRTLVLANRTRKRAEAACARLQTFHPQTEMRVFAGEGPPFDARISEDGRLHSRVCFDMLINATSLGLHVEDVLPFLPESLQGSLLAAEVVMQPRETPFLRCAIERGCRVHTGNHMLEAQMDLLCRFWGV